MNAHDATPPVLATALDCAARGWLVFPAKIADGAKKSYIAGKAHGGERWGATADVETIRSYWAQFPQALLGIPCGPVSGLFVVECDTPEGHDVDGIAEMQALIEKHGPLPDTIEALSPTGSWHLYFRWPEGETITNSSKVVAPGIDVRGEGGMVIAPPSRREGFAKTYRWKNPPGFFDLSECPEWLLDLCRKKQKEPPPALDYNPPPRTPLRIDTGDLGEIRDLLATAPNHLDRDDWVRLALALKGAHGDALREDFMRFSYRWVGDTRNGDPERTWDTAEPSGSVSIATAFHLLRGEDRTRVYVGRSAVIAPRSEEPEGPLFSPATRWAAKRVPEREWHVGELIPANQVTLLGGEPGTGKSLLAKQLAVSTAAGATWLGRRIERPGPALYLSAEDDEDELHRRVAGICDAEGIDLASLGDLYMRSLAGEDALLALPDRKFNTLAATALYNRLDEEVGDRRATLIGLDTLADLHAGDEVSRAHARQFIGMLRHLGIRHRCAVVVLAHPSLTGINSGSGLSGSTAWGASVRARLYLERVAEDGYEPDPDLRRLVTKKSNYSRLGEEIAMRYQGGRFVAEEPPGGLDRMAAQAKAERVFLRLLDDFAAQGRHVSAIPGTTYAPTVFAKSGRAEGLTKQQLQVAMERLLHAKSIQIEKHGPPSRERTHLGRCTE